MTPEALREMADRRERLGESTGPMMLRGEALKIEEELAKTEKLARREDVHA